MTKHTSVILVPLSIVGSFLLGSWYSRRPVRRNVDVTGQRILYYHDPMHPAYKSDKPGTAPDCGMRLEPVYAGIPSLETHLSPVGAVQISPEKQQIIGVRVGYVENRSVTYIIRALGRVAADQNRIYQVNAAVDGWIREIFPNSIGSLVEKDQALAAFYSSEFLGPEQAYVYALDSVDRSAGSGKESSLQMALNRANAQRAVDSLGNLGMSAIQVEEIKRTRQLTQNILLRAPASGFLLVRNVSPDLRFERGAELYRIADLSHVWVLADLLENDASYIRPGQKARVSYQGRTFEAKMSDVLPQIDLTTRTLKARSELDNPGYALRPDMFVDVDIAVKLPLALTVPVDSVVDSGLKKTVFVDRGDGYFEPRQVETGWRHGESVQIVKGLDAGERIVVSGTFLIDSESRLRQAAASAPIEDLSCGMGVDPAKVATTSAYKGRSYYFCSQKCKEKFERNPEQYIERQQLALHL